MTHRIVRLVIIAAIVLSAGTSLVLRQSAYAAEQSTYYVDCIVGQDTFSGTSPISAWKTVNRANTQSLVPGDQLLLKRGCTFAGALKARWNGTADRPITIGSYGVGEMPIVQNASVANVKITGSYQIIEQIQTLHTDGNYPTLAANCRNQPVGWKLGFSFEDSAHHNMVRSVRTNNHAVGVNFTNGSHHNQLLSSEIRDNAGLWRLIDPLGGLGVNLHGNANEVAWNTFADNRAICGLDASGQVSPWKPSLSIELFNATNSTIHHNRSTDRVFMEMGSGTITSTDNTIAYNAQASSETRSRFVVTRGAGAPAGPVWRTALYHNVVYNTGDDSQGVTCGACSADVLTLQNNIIVAKTKALYVDTGTTLSESHNLYWTPVGLPLPNNFIQNVAIAPSSLVAQPGFVNADAGDFHLVPESPAIDQGGDRALLAGYAHDIDVDAVPQAAAPDLGIDETPAGSVDPINDAPVVTAPTQMLTEFRTEQVNVPALISWTANDSDGISTHELEQSTNGGAFETVKTLQTGETSKFVGISLTPGRTYQFRVRVTDGLGATSEWMTGASFMLTGYQESDAAIVTTGNWAAATTADAFGGNVAHASDKGSVARLTFTGSSVAWVSTVGPDTGKAEVWLDGVKMKTVDLYRPEVNARRVVFNATNLTVGSHTIEIRVLGAKNASSSARRIDLDGFVVTL